MKAQNENGKKTMTETGTQTQNDVAREKKDSMSLLYVVFCGLFPPALVTLWAKAFLYSIKGKVPFCDKENSFAKLLAITFTLPIYVPTLVICKIRDIMKNKKQNKDLVVQMDDVEKENNKDLSRESDFGKEQERRDIKEDLDKSDDKLQDIPVESVVESVDRGMSMSQ